MVTGLFFWMLAILAPLAPVSPGAAHPYFVSITEVEHNAGTQSLEITCRIFTDDFEKALSKQFNTRVDLYADQFKNAATVIPGYIGQHLKITADGKLLTLKFAGYERQKDACWCYFEVAGVSAPQKISIVNNLLHDFTDKQINMMHVTVGGTRKSYKLDYPEKTKEFVF